MARTYKERFPEFVDFLDVIDCQVKLLTRGRYDKADLSWRRLEEFYQKEEEPKVVAKQLARLLVMKG